jgi:hypothetical protein
MALIRATGFTNEGRTDPSSTDLDQGWTPFAARLSAQTQDKR